LSAALRRPAARRGQGVAPGDQRRPAATGVGGHRDVAGQVRPPDGCPGALQLAEQTGVGMVVVVARAHADQHRPRRDGGEELR
jgi:hypothetical protein